MNIANVPQSEIQELGGESLEGSGFEDETPSPAFEPFVQTAEEGAAQ
jgi:hypothetical protein